MDPLLAFSTETNTYAEMESKHDGSYIRRTIDGHHVGCNKCVAFCKYDEHSGYLTHEQRKNHDCLGKNCFYYVPKPEKKKKTLTAKSEKQEILSAANEVIMQEGIRFLDAVQYDFKKWKLGYITITNDYSLSHVKERLEEVFNCEIIFSKKQYPYDRCVQLLFDM